MAVFSTNQNRQLFVATGYTELANAKAVQTFADGAKVGSIALRQDTSACPSVYFLYKWFSILSFKDFI